MGKLISTIGNLLIALSLGGAALLVFGPEPGELLHARPGPAPAAGPAAPARSAPALVTGPSATGPPAAGPRLVASDAAERDRPGFGLSPTDLAALHVDETSLPITRVAIPSIGLDAEVVEAAFVERDGATTWEIPRFKAGHAQFTAGAGDRGNAILLGHVSSLRSGDVFRDLDRAAVGDTISIYAGAAEFRYRVGEVRTVRRDDRSILETTEAASLSLITCAGSWLPTIWDYTERLVVRAELYEAPTSASRERPADPSVADAPSG